MRRSISTFVMVLPVTVFLATGVSAQNLLINPDFDTDLAGWEGPAVWDPADAFGSPSSGSATWINNFTAGGSSFVRQCVELSPWIEGYDVAAHVFIPSAQPGSGYTYITVAFYSDATCDTFIVGFGSQSAVAFDVWTPLNFTGWTPNGAAGAKIAVTNQKTAPGDFQTFADSVYFARNPEMVFGDGFESGDTSGWSAVSGGME